MNKRTFLKTLLSLLAVPVVFKPKDGWFKIRRTKRVYGSQDGLRSAVQKVAEFQNNGQWVMLNGYSTFSVGCDKPDEFSRNIPWLRTNKKGQYIGWFYWGGKDWISCTT